jgi:predicted PurR-regulated permease PerM
LHTVELQIQNARIAAYALAFVPALGIWMMLAKYFAGEFPLHGVIWGAVAIAAFATMIGAAVWHRYRTKLVPRRTELRDTLRKLESEAPE